MFRDANRASAGVIKRVEEFNLETNVGADGNKTGEKFLVHTPMKGS
jgi:hypothetical protein